MEIKKKMNPSHFLLPGCMFIGIGIGFLLNFMAAGLMIGLGTGFLSTAIYKMYNPNNE